MTTAYGARRQEGHSRRGKRRHAGRGAELGINRDHAGIIELECASRRSSRPAALPDSIIEIDNKSLTHRPDLWGHHGMAREVAAILGAS